MKKLLQIKPNFSHGEIRLYILFTLINQATRVNQEAFLLNEYLLIESPSMMFMSQSFGKSYFLL